MTIFGSVSLAARIERAECSILLGGAEAARSGEDGARVLARPIAGGIAVWGGDGSPLVKVAGVGFEGELSESDLEQVESEFVERGAAPRFELANLASPAVGERLTRRGYRLEGYENVLGKKVEAGGHATIAEGVEIAVSSEADFDAWLDCVVGGFASPDLEGLAGEESFPREILARVIRDLTAGAGFVRYLARRGGVPAGGASLRLHDGLAQLTGAATLPAHRRRGVQSSLLAARLADAARHGCDLAVITTSPGSKSQENAQRQGFELLYTRAVLVRPLPGETPAAL